MNIIAVPYAHYLLVAIIIEIYNLYIYHIHTMVVVEYNSVYHISMWCLVGTCWAGNTEAPRKRVCRKLWWRAGIRQIGCLVCTTAVDEWTYLELSRVTSYEMKFGKVLYWNVASCKEIIFIIIQILFIANSEDEKNLEVLTPDTWLCCKFHTPVSQPSNQGQTVKIYCIFFVSPFAYWLIWAVLEREGG